MIKKIIFRADGNNATGLGHMYRLFALVEMLKDNYEYIYITRVNSETSIIPKKYNVKFIPLSVDYAEEANWLAENFAPKEYILIADGYQFVSNYQKRIIILGFKMVYIDDLAKEYMHADIVVNHSPGFVEDDYQGTKEVKYLLGSKYALLRSDFLESTKQNKSAVSELNSVFICFGGSDSNDLSYKCAKAIVLIKSIQKINIVIGAAYKGEILFELQKQHLDKIYIHKNLASDKMVNLIKSNNLAIVPSSTICFELFSIRIPVISGFFIENQVKAYHNFKQLGCFVGVGDFNVFDFNRISEIIENKKFAEYLERYSTIQSKLIDGFQKTRYIEIIDNLN